jgi:hypothetical protein
LRTCQGCRESDFAADRGRITGVFIALGIALLGFLVMTYVFTYRTYLLSLGRAKKRELEDRAREIYKALGEFG